MASRYSDKEAMKWEVEDVTKLSYQKDTFNVILDKVIVSTELLNKS